MASSIGETKVLIERVDRRISKQEKKEKEKTRDWLISSVNFFSKNNWKITQVQKCCWFCDLWRSMIVGA